MQQSFRPLAGIRVFRTKEPVVAELWASLCFRPLAGIRVFRTGGLSNYRIAASL